MTIRNVVTKSFIALGFAGAMAVSFPSASSAQGFFFEGPGGVRFGAGQPSRWRATHAPRERLRWRLGNRDWIATPAPRRPFMRRPELVVRVPLDMPRANRAFPNRAGADSALARADRAIRRAGGSWSIQ
jgi:hypothetical protein